MPYIHFTDAEKEAANSADIVSYLKTKGMEILLFYTRFQKKKDRISKPEDIIFVNAIVGIPKLYMGTT